MVFQIPNGLDFCAESAEVKSNRLKEKTNFHM
jgi:hypothetical protein